MSEVPHPSYTDLQINEKVDSTLMSVLMRPIITQSLQAKRPVRTLAVTDSLCSLREMFCARNSQQRSTQHPV